jgi:hypothetical protein
LPNTGNTRKATNPIQMFRTHVSHVSRYQERPWHVQFQEAYQLSTTTKSPNDINPSQGAVISVQKKEKNFTIKFINMMT